MDKISHFFGLYIDAFICWRDFSGTSNRTQFWSFMIISWGADALMRIADSTWDLFLYVGSSVTDSTSNVGVFTLSYLIVSAIPMASIMCRRLHDADMPGWLGFFALTPIIGFPLGIAISFLKSNKNSRWAAKPQKRARVERR